MHPILLATLLGMAPTSAPAPTAADDVATFIVVRHAEKSTDDPRDPSLDAAGHARAHRLAAALADRGVVATYATGYRRTQQTAQPVARQHDLDVLTYEASQAATVFADALRKAHRAGTVLVVGHSNTVPGIASALCSCEVPDMGEDEYDRLYEITMGAEGQATLRAGTQP